MFQPQILASYKGFEMKPLVITRRRVDAPEPLEPFENSAAVGRTNRRFLRRLDFPLSQHWFFDEIDGQSCGRPIIVGAAQPGLCCLSLVDTRRTLTFRIGGIVRMHMQADPAPISIASRVMGCGQSTRSAPRLGAYLGACSPLLSFIT